jgi:hypothetical protein
MGRRELRTRLCCGDIREGYHLEYLGVDGMIILKMGLLEIGSGSLEWNDVALSWNLVCVWLWTFGAYEMWGMSWLADELLVSHEVLQSVGFTIPAHLHLDFTNTVNNSNLHSTITSSSTDNCIIKLQPQFILCSPLGTCVYKIFKSTYRKGPYFLRKFVQQRARNLALLSSELATRLRPNRQ